MESFVISSDKYRADEKCFASSSMVQNPYCELDITFQGIPYFEEPQRIVHFFLSLIITNKCLKVYVTTIKIRIL